MTALIVTESLFGNTLAIAEAIGGGIAEVHGPSDGARGACLPGAGGAARGRRPAGGRRPDPPALAAQCRQPARRGGQGCAPRAADRCPRVDRVGGHPRRAAGRDLRHLDSRPHRPRHCGRAPRPERCACRGAEPIVGPSFFVTGMEGPLADGELGRATAWGRELAGALASTRLSLTHALRVCGLETPFASTAGLPLSLKNPGPLPGRGRARMPKPIVSRFWVVPTLVLALLLSFVAATPAQAADRTSSTEARRVDRVKTPKLAWVEAEDGAGYSATVKLPRDYDKPKGATVTVALFKIPAADPARRIGTLFLNPGGPGGSGVDIALRSNELPLPVGARPLRHHRLRPARHQLLQQGALLLQHRTPGRGARRHERRLPQHGDGGEELHLRRQEARQRLLRLRSHDGIVDVHGRGGP